MAMPAAITAGKKKPGSADTRTGQFHKAINSIMQPTIIIDQEFKALIPPLSQEERAQLEANILADGCRDPLVVWATEGDFERNIAPRHILVDGHNRYEICTRHGIEFDVTELEFADREAAMDWMDANQLGRRNLTRDQFTLLIGRRYNRAKKAAGGRADRDFSGAQIDPPKTMSCRARAREVTP